MSCIGSCRGPEAPGLVAPLLTGHPWVAAARAVVRQGISGLLVVPTTAGLRAYRCIGRAGIATEWVAHLGAPMPGLWRLVEALPHTHDGTGDEMADAMLRTPLPDWPVEMASSIGPDGDVHYGLRVPLELAIFRPHFPVAPIVPGVEQVRWAVTFSQRHFALPMQFAGLDMLRFRRVMQPGSVLQLTLRSVTGSGTLHFAFRSGEGPEGPLISDGRILFRHAGSV